MQAPSGSRSSVEKSLPARYWTNEMKARLCEWSLLQWKGVTGPDKGA